jgi:hypothetical protein
MKSGQYGTVKDGQFFAPTEGPYIGALQNYDEVEMKKLKELLFGPEKM